MIKPELVLAVDLGTTCFKAALFDRMGRMTGLGRVTVEKEEREGNTCELPVGRFWHTLSQAVSNAVHDARVEANAIRAVCYSSQANSFLLLDKGEAPLTPLILWPDRRAAHLPRDPRLKALWSRRDFLATTGLGLQAPEFCLEKLAWYQRRHPDVWAACARVQTISDYLALSLTGEPVGDRGTVSLLGLWNLPGECWWSEALEAAGIRQDQLSRPLQPGTLAGVTGPEVTRMLGLPAGIPVAVGSLDHHAAAIGAGICSADVPSISIGTTVACLRYEERWAPLAGCAMGPGTHGFPFYRLSFEENGTGALDRYHRAYCPEVPFAEMLTAVDVVPPGSDGLMASAGIGSFRETFGPVASGHTRAHFVRALMESTAASLFEMIERLHPDSLPPRVVVTGGGTRSDSWLRIFADLSGIEFALPGCVETGCLGAGMMGAVAAGWFDSLEAVSRSWREWSRIIPPDPEAHARYRRWLSDYRVWKESCKEER